MSFLRSIWGSLNNRFIKLQDLSGDYMREENIEWLRCPVCGSKTREKIRADTELKNFPLYCPKCKQESLIDVKNLHIEIIKEPDA